jgi:hypothetical protein
MKGVCLIVFFLGVCMGPAIGLPSASYATALNLMSGAGRLAMCKTSERTSKNSRTAQSYVTESGYLAAVEEELLDRAIFWAGMGNEDEFMRFIASTDLVFPLKGGLRVFVEKFSFSGKVKIRPEGSDIAVWTIREAIRSELPVGGT